MHVYVLIFGDALPPFFMATLPVLSVYSREEEPQAWAPHAALQASQSGPWGFPQATSHPSSTFHLP